jgi:NADH:ubiquinone oxidoreductase subunit D
VAVDYFSPRLLCRFDLVFRASASATEKRVSSTCYVENIAIPIRINYYFAMHHSDLLRLAVESIQTTNAARAGYFRSSLSAARHLPTKVND